MSDSIASELLQKWVSTVKGGDPKQVVNLYLDDGILLGTFSNKERVGHESVSYTHLTLPTILLV